MPTRPRKARLPRLASRSTESAGSRNPNRGAGEAGGAIGVRATAPLRNMSSTRRPPIRTKGGIANMLFCEGRENAGSTLRRLPRSHVRPIAASDVATSPAQRLVGLHIHPHGEEQAVE